MMVEEEVGLLEDNECICVCIGATGVATSWSQCQLSQRAGGRAGTEWGSRGTAMGPSGVRIDQRQLEPPSDTTLQPDSQHGWRPRAAEAPSRRLGKQAQHDLP